MKEEALLSCGWHDKKTSDFFRAFWYNQFLVIWGGKAPVPTAGRFPDSKLNARRRLPKPDGSVTGAKAP